MKRAFVDTTYKTLNNLAGQEFQILEQQGVWTDTGPNGVIPNARAALFDVQFIFDRPGDSTLPARGQIRFFVSGRDSLVNGVTRTYYTMIGQQDLTNTGQNAYIVDDGDRICQGELVRNIPTHISETLGKPARKTDRAGGFGSTGTK